MPRRNPIKGPVTRLPDGNGGEIEVCSPSELRRRKLILIKKQNGICPLCNKPMHDVRETDLDHIVPRPAGCKKDSSWGNIQAVHHLCNLEKGSKRT
jgi:5-methylcytosine-specific restriction endonuclease McrA